MKTELTVQWVEPQSKTDVSDFYTADKCVKRDYRGKKVKKNTGNVYFFINLEMVGHKLFCDGFGCKYLSEAAAAAAFFPHIYHFFVSSHHLPENNISI